MLPILMELKPNRLLLDSNFDGYKLSLQEIPKKHKDLPIPVDRVLLNTQQYSLLHANLYGLHNHLIGDPFDDSTSVYFIDSDFHIRKTYVDPFDDELIDPITVLQLPKSRERKCGDYNVSLKFFSLSEAVVGDGVGNLLIVNTGSRNDDDTFTITYQDEITGQEEPFVIVDSRLGINEELHVLAVNLKQGENEKFYTVLHWVTFSKIQDVWGQIALKQVKVQGCVQYSYIEKDCNAIYVVSDTESKFITNSDVPVTEIKKLYKWSQNIEDITIKIQLPEGTTKQQIKVSSENMRIEVKCGDDVLICGELYNNINNDMTTWILEQNNLEITLNKSETGDMWQELVKNDSTGEYVVETCIDTLNRLRSNNEEITQTGTTFTSQPVEECDFESDKTVTFERLCGKINSTTHKIILGSHQVLLTALLTPDYPPAIGIKHDVDICLWQPQFEENDFVIKHEGTLLALGYVQASKQNRKFTVCPQNMSYAIICESTGHLFIYKQNQLISNSELRNRSTGRRVQNIAQQQVVNLASDEVLGIYASNKFLFLLFESKILVLTF